ncbi:glycosyltransferase family 2 protein [Cellulomonas xiejunii]|uniref:Glycosyltransferase family 2 protein n=1 Tax=Cellulomonas xiejunii TaxID=2968083 RepID=A0ABY5KLC8_9CELL|nr:glycosyltransferase family 2 protein [Cellulomonas xiejunii]MCC2312904.1 glycosyltransferase family 2 protein [Cellulomonas xiejunii]MCC2320226.1 glycosyltransferase family 2 protein [Cellulomonas xiejunii]UUI70533.1 glycosyltransferase family 2 protein [Cellulomonas xiejunii]
MTGSSEIMPRDDVPTGRKLISVVIPAYNESDCVDELATRMAAVMDSESTYDWEVIVVENGSTDDTWEKLCKIRESDPRFKILQLARNFRMDGGLTAGLAHATGDAAVVMTADLQDPPELIPAFLRKWEDGYENIYMVVSRREGTGPVRTFNSKAFYWVAGKLTAGAIPRNASDFRLVDRGVYETINTMQERNRFIRGLFAWAGYNSIGIEHERPPRFGGESKAHSLKVLDLAFKGIFAHSYVPLRLITITGLSVSALSLLVLVVFAVRFVATGVPFAGYGTLVGFILLLFGVLFSMIGILSEYVGLIYEEVKQRPNFVVRRKVGL